MREMVTTAFQEKRLVPILVEKTNVLDGSAIATVRLAKNPVTGKPEVEIQFTEPGTRRWTEITRANVHHTLAILYRGRVVEAPIIAEPIESGQLQVAGDLTEAEMADMIRELNRAQPRDPSSTGSASDSQAQWGDPVEGVSLRLPTDKVDWHAGEIPSLRFSLRNQSTNAFSWKALQEYGDLEIDGFRYVWYDGTLWEGTTPILAPGSEQGNIQFDLGDKWRQRTGLFGRPVIGGPTLRLLPGRHTVRLSVFVGKTNAAAKDIRLMSNPLEIEVKEGALPAVSRTNLSENEVATTPVPGGVMEYEVKGRL